MRKQHWYDKNHENDNNRSKKPPLRLVRRRPSHHMPFTSHKQQLNPPLPPTPLSPIINTLTIRRAGHPSLPHLFTFSNSSASLQALSLFIQYASSHSPRLKALNPPSPWPRHRQSQRYSTPPPPPPPRRKHQQQRHYSNQQQQQSS